MPAPVPHQAASAAESLSDLPIVAIVGATATGKSDLALDLAERLDGEIINADALQLYRGMDIGTAKVGAAERERVPHHLLDVLEVTQEASVSTYQREARAVVAQVRGRGRVPVVVGGSGLYVRALLDDIRFPPTDPDVRDRLERRAQSEGVDSLRTELERTDPEAAAAIGAQDVRRIVRALEVGEITGGSFRAFLPRRQYLDAATLQIGLHREREELRERVAVRVDRMVEQGLLDEVRALRAQGLDEGATARRAIGYEQALAVLDGAMTCREAVDATVAGTRRLVRKQDTWFRRDERTDWLPASSDDLLARALDLVAAHRRDVRA
ncbi:tRNA (adenosine(37)-N6)-dimethylallyltransferase MiaA [Brachybacterium subflavum]|uniref:tRNA (adenosine(37)-N6)-dimethylallyltransferase MiaA n=1 Tax=Brachybacterium subflavum TaxID=2585206 RepID=UPI0012662A03|nr:tRNA (adenosine(37)-N6)-dimethylallyltransferase MiaA [Brachybacterium subflavum]